MRPDAAVRRVEAEIVRAQALDTGVAASTTSGTSSDSTGSIPIIGIESESREITQTETEAAEIRHIREGKSEPLGGGTDSDSDQLRQMLQAIGRALDLAVHPERTSNPIGNEQAEPQPIEANFPNSRKASGPLALSNFPGSLDESVGLGTTIVSMPRGTVVVPQVGADFDRKSDLPPRAHAGVAVARSMLMQLTNMALAIVICCVVFAVIYFTVNIRNWLGL